MLVTLLGIVMEVKPWQFAKAIFPMLVTLLGIVMEVRLLQLWKAPSPMLVTLLGIIVFLQPAISVLDDVSIIALQSLLSYLVFSLATTMLVRPVQPPKAATPMLVTLLGMVMLVGPVHP